MNLSGETASITEAREARVKFDQGNALSCLN